ncbi:PH domain-containing protein [Entamoeba marina]
MQGQLQHRNTNQSFAFSKINDWILLDNIFQLEKPVNDQPLVFFLTDIDMIAPHKSKNCQFAIKYTVQKRSVIYEFIASSPEKAKEWVSTLNECRNRMKESKSTTSEIVTSSISSSKFKLQIDPTTNEVKLTPKSTE